MHRTTLLLALAATACASASKGQRPDDRPSPAEYRIGREDVIEVVVWHEPELSKVMPVRPDGFIAIPLAGEIQAAGKTPGELKEALAKALTPYVKDAAVAVLVREINGPRYFVMGEVTKPGGYPLRGSMSVTQALATAGGLGEFASDEVLWLRQKSDGTTDKVKLSAKELMQGEAEGALWLGAGDVLYVP
jgi:polysaccharide export outer membrane protein